MKKILFIQLKGKSFGGVWQVIKTTGEELIKKGYDVSVVSLRENKNDIQIKKHPKLNLYTINQQDIWEHNYSGQEILNDIKKAKLLAATKKLIVRFKHKISIKKDIKKLHRYIYQYQPDYIITCHYELLDMIPKSYLNKTIHQQHSSFADAKRNRNNIKLFNKYKNKITFLWLTKKTMEKAIECGYQNSRYIYNAVRFKSQEKANVVANKKLITIARLSEDKSIDKMIAIAKDIFKDSKYKDWILEIYGEGHLENQLKKQINNHKQIKLMGLTDNPKEVLLNSSINLNTSPYEGFSLSILEANECGIPTIAFDFGESSTEQILHNKTGIIAKDMEDYKIKLKQLMDNPNELQELSINAKEFSKNFQIEQIINKWIELFEEFDK